MSELSKPCPCQDALAQNAFLVDGILQSNLRVPPAEPCSCSPYSVLCCCGPNNGISIIQPACQTLPDGRVVNNPALDTEAGKSYWTYKFMTDCNSTTRGISNIGIPICNLILAANLIVREKIDGCGSFIPVPFTLTTNDPNLGPAPDGFQFVKIETNSRFDVGVTVEYQLEIVGDYPVAIQPISVKAATNILIFDCECFLVPACNPEGELSLTKECSSTINNNQAFLNYDITVNNIGDAPLSNVQFNDTITIPINLRIGAITVTPDFLTVNVGPSGQITISGNLGTLAPGGQIVIRYTIQITGVSSPGSYTVTNLATAAATGTQAFSSCSTVINAVQLTTQKCCSIEGNAVTYRFIITSVGLSPDIKVDVSDNLFIPGGITVRCTNFSGCTATFANTEEQVPLNIDITGPRRIVITCKELLIPNSGSAHRDISFLIVSSTFVGLSLIENEVEAVTPTTPDAQIFLGAGALPVKADILVNLTLSCTNPCND